MFRLLLLLTLLTPLLAQEAIRITIHPDLVNPLIQGKLDELRTAEKFFEVFDALLKGFQGFVVFQIPDVMTEEGVIFVRDAKFFQRGTLPRRQ